MRFGACPFKEEIAMEKFWLYAANLFGIVILVLLIWWLATTFLL
jgi:hypothetical protein